MWEQDNEMQEVSVYSMAWLLAREVSADLNAEKSEMNSVRI